MAVLLVAIAHGDLGAEAANASAMARPIPTAAPVTIATRPVRSAFSGPTAMWRQTTDVVLDDVLADDPRIARVAGGLRERGVKRGDVVSWRMPNSDVPMLLYRACWRVGAIAAPVHHLGDIEPPGPCSTTARRAGHTAIRPDTPA